jgi:hypothetical protein
VKLNKEQLKGVLSSMCDKAFKQYRLDHVFDFTGESQPDVFRSGTHHEGERGIECYLKFKYLSEEKGAPNLGVWTSNHQMHIHFSQRDIDAALIDFATTQKHVPQGANVNHNCEVHWLGSAKAEVEVIIDVTYDDPADFQ